MNRVAWCYRCGDLFPHGTSVCKTCQPAEKAERDKGKQHHRLQQTALRRVAAAAAADPSAVCWLCERRQPPDGYDGRWSGDHVDPGELDSEIRPAHLGCNSARGNRTVGWFRQHLANRS